MAEGLHWTKLQELFTELIGLPGDERAAALRSVHHDDPALAKELQELLEADDRIGGFPEMNTDHLLLEAFALSSPKEIGPYRLLGMLGEGGMGVVYLAERPDIAGKVAVKLLRDAWLSPMRRQRFTLEQQTLGVLNHPSVARIYDAGITADGTPWFAMEFVDGKNVVEYLRLYPLTIAARIELFREICIAVRYAHSHAIIHRDLKPSNILVTETIEGTRQVKLLDFGIAKQLAMAKEDGATTIAGTRLFTPAYAAPELHRLEQAGVYSDVFSLGVILYEMLTGAVPYSQGDFSRQASRPSQVARETESGVALGLSHLEWSDLDAVCMKALDRDPDARYASVDALIAELDALLECRPVTARKHTFLYTARSFARRNRGPLFATCAAVILLVAVAGFFTIRLARARNAAIAAAAHSEQVQRFTESLFTGGSEDPRAVRNLNVAALLDRGRSKAMQIHDDPVLQNEMFRILGSAYYSFGQFAIAESLLVKSKQALCAAGRTLECGDVEAALGVELSSHRASDSLALLRDSLDIKQRLLAPGDPSIVRTMIDLALMELASDDLPDARQHFTRAFELTSSDDKPSAVQADAMAYYARIVLPYKDPQKVVLTRRSAQINKQLYGPDSYEYALSLEALGNLAETFGLFDASEQYFRQAVRADQLWAVSDESSPNFFENQLNFLLALEGRYAEARKMLLAEIPPPDKRSHMSDYDLGKALFILGFIDLHQGHLSAAQQGCNSVVAMAQEGRAIQDVDLKSSHLCLAIIDAQRGDYARSRSEAQLVIADTTEVNLYIVAAAHAVLGHTLLLENKLTDARRELESAYAWFSHDVTVRPETAEDYRDLAVVDARLGDSQAASRLGKEFGARVQQAKVLARTPLP